MLEIQEIFLVVYSVLWGAMLQSLGKIQPFPWNRVLSKETCQCLYCNNIVTFTYGQITRRRLTLSLVLLNIIPFSFLILVYYSLRTANAIFYYPWKFLPVFIYVLWSSFAVFGFYRFYHVFMICKQWWFCDRLKFLLEREIGKDPIGHFLGGCLYFIPPFIMMVIINFKIG